MLNKNGLRCLQISSVESRRKRRRCQEREGRRQHSKRRRLEEGEKQLIKIIST
jgi:hypothetical protein